MPNRPDGNNVSDDQNFSVDVDLGEDDIVITRVPPSEVPPEWREGCTDVYEVTRIDGSNTPLSTPATFTLNLTPWNAWIPGAWVKTNLPCGWVRLDQNPGTPINGVVVTFGVVAGTATMTWTGDQLGKFWSCPDENEVTLSAPEEIKVGSKSSANTAARGGEILIGGVGIEVVNGTDDDLNVKPCLGAEGDVELVGNEPIAFDVQAGAVAMANFSDEVICRRIGGGFVEVGAEITHANVNKKIKLRAPIDCVEEIIVDDGFCDVIAHPYVADLKAMSLEIFGDANVLCAHVTDQVVTTSVQNPYDASSITPLRELDSNRSYKLYGAVELSLTAEMISAMRSAFGCSSHANGSALCAGGTPVAGNFYFFTGVMGADISGNGRYQVGLQVDTLDNGLTSFPGEHEPLEGSDVLMSVQNSKGGLELFVDDAQYSPLSSDTTAITYGNAIVFAVPKADFTALGFRLASNNGIDPFVDGYAADQQPRTPDFDPIWMATSE